MVTSVPSDAPDDYAALRDVQKKKVHVHHHNIYYTQELMSCPSSVQ